MTVKRRVIDAISSAAHRRGYNLTPEWHMDALPLARHLAAVFKRHDVDCVLDVGANKGQYHDFLREQVGYAGTILSFEPVSKYVAMLKKRAADDPRWTILDHALGAERSTAEINVTTSPGLNSFLQPREDQVQGFWDDQVVVKETVRIERLDDLFDELRSRFGFTSPYLKLDTQGFDLQVVAGGTDALRSVKALQTEASVKPIYQSMPDYRVTIDAMTRYGFEVSGMFPVSLDERLRLIEFDCVMVRAGD